MWLPWQPTCVCIVCSAMFHTIYRFWFLFHPLRDSVPANNWIGDDIYLAIVLFGVGGTALSVVGLTHLSLLVGENTVSVINEPQEGIDYNHTHVC